MNLFKRVFYKLFIGGYWIVAYRKKGDDVFKLIKNQKNHWNADPFGYEKNGSLFLFTELYDCKKEIGRIACSLISDSNYNDTRIIIKNNKHMSYPSVFKQNDKVFLMPENSQDGELNVYDITESLFEPILVKTILVSNEVVDCTIGFFDKNIILIGYSEQKKSLFFGELTEKFELKSALSFLPFSKKTRPAGSFLQGHIRPAQNNENKYGESICFYKSSYSKNEGFSENLLKTITSKDIMLLDTNIKPQKIHTYNETENFEIIDLYVEKFDLFRWLKMFRRRLHKYEKKKNYN